MRFGGELAALGTASCWAIGSNLFAGAGRRMGPLVLNRLRILTAALLLTTTLWVARGSPWPWWASRDQLGLLALSGLIGFAFGDTWYFRSLVVLGAGRAALCAALAPLITAVIGWSLLGERLGPMAWLGMALTLGGIAWVMLERQTREHASRHGRWAAGVAAGVLGAIGQAIGFAISKLALRSGLDPLSAATIRIVTGLVALWGWAALRGQVPATLAALRDRRAGAFMVGGSVFGPFLGVLLSLASLALIEAGVSAAIIAVYPIFALVISSRFHGEPLTARSLVGGLVAVAGVVVLFLR